MATELSKKIKVALDETRVLILAAQILTGFQFRGVFEEGFSELPVWSRYADGAALLLMILVLGLLILPGPFHRRVEKGEDTGRLHRLVGRVMALALVPFAASLGIDVFLAAERIAGTGAGVATGAATAGLAAAFWFGFGELRKGSVGERERQMTREQVDEVQRTPLHTKIEHLLTEARVVLPGAQALLGFQLAIVLTKAFEQMPGSLKLVHGAALLCVALAVVLLMTPAAYHRIVYGGEDSEEFHRTGSHFVTWSTVPLAIGIAADVFVVGVKILEAPLAAGIVAASVLLLLLGLWHGIPLVARTRHEQREKERFA
jgi:Family of unknown function (DUF6328)